MSSRRTILYFEPVAEKGGAEEVLLQLVGRLDRSRFRPVAACLGRGPLLRELAARDVPVHTYPAHRLSNFPVSWLATIWLGLLASREKADIVHAQGTKAQIYAAPASCLAGSANLWHIHDPPAPGLSGIDRIALALPRDRVVANSPVTRSGFEPYLGGEPVCTIPPGVEVGPPHERSALEEVRRRWDVTPQEFLVVSIGRLQEFKGHRYLLEAVRLLASSGVPVRALVIGGALFGIETGYPDRLRSMIDKLGLASRVRMTGFLPDGETRLLAAAADCLAHTALEEPFGLAVAEAMAAGTPPVAFASTGPRTLVEHEVSGLLVPVGDAKALAEAIARLAADREYARRLGAAARERVALHFSVEAMVRRFERVYEELAP
ncbi:MAG: glycosyltransferase family 4 protein [Planctomycetes bacterium]|nr:glycosyltransferase family 4 protein [Planctomycetota bacterium]